MEFNLSEQVSTQLTSKDITVLAIFITTSGISVIASFFICYFYIRYKNIREDFSSKIVFLLAICDIIPWFLRFITSIHEIASNKNFSKFPKQLCILIGFVWQLFTIQSFFLALLITIAIYLNFCLKKSFEETKKKSYYLCVFFFFLSFVISLIPLILDNYGTVNTDDSIKCWIHDVYIMILNFYLPLWIIYILIIGMIIHIYIIYKKEGITNEEMSTKFVRFPIVFLICWLIPSIRRIYNAFHDDSFFLKVLMYIFMPLQGLVNAIIYGMINSFVKMKLQEYFKCLRSNNVLESPSIKEKDTEYNENTFDENQINLDLLENEKN